MLSFALLARRAATKWMLQGTAAPRQMVTLGELLNGVSSRLVYEGSSCDSHPCWNDGICHLDGPSNYTCECLPLFAGQNCQYKVYDLCASVICLSLNRCVVRGVEVQCAPFRSREFLSSCLTTKCLNGGTCSNATGGHRCICPHIFHGPFCQFDSSETSNEWTTTEIAIFFFVVFMVIAAITVVCCTSNSHVGFYISVPNKNYNRWEEEEDLCEDNDTSSGEHAEFVAMADVKKGIVVSRTRETILDEFDGPSILQL